MDQKPNKAFAAHIDAIQRGAVTRATARNGRVGRRQRCNASARYWHAYLVRQCRKTFS